LVGQLTGLEPRDKNRFPHGHRKEDHARGRLRLSGVTATRMLDGSINGERFLEYVKEVLVPTLVPGDLVVTDNLSSHKSHPAREARMAQATAPVLDSTPPMSSSAPRP